MRRLWFGAVAKQNKSPSLELLKSLYSVLVKNAIVTDHNKTLVVEVLRSIAETVIWGDQNDPRVFDFFLEKGIQSYFLSIIEQPKCGTYVCTQLLQTLNILFENIRNETSIYFLLSNNHVNSIICHEFDFSDEEIMAYYISFVKTLSLKLNSNTIHFFYNEHLRDFPLYTEAIKFFNHSESMVRIAVRTLTLNVFQVGDDAIVKFIHDKTAAPYFSNLVWFIGNNVLMMERCLRTEANHLTRNKLESLVALHLDDVHYVQDIMQLQIKTLNSLLCEHLLNTLFIPLYVYSLDPSLTVDSPQVSVKCALFLLSQVFIILNHPPLVKQLKLYICFEENPNLENSETVRRFTKPSSQIQDTLKPAVIPKNKQNLQPTKLAKEHKEELRAREARRVQEESRLKDMEKYQKTQKFSQTGYLKSILDPDPGTDPLSGTRVRRVESLKHSNTKSSDPNPRKSSSVSRRSSVHSETACTGEDTEGTPSFLDPLEAVPLSTADLPENQSSKDTESGEDDAGTTKGDDSAQTEGRFSTPDPEDVLEEVQNPEYPVSEDSGIVSSETMENIAQDIEDEAEGQPEVDTLDQPCDYPSEPSPPPSPVMESGSTKTLSYSTENSSFDTEQAYCEDGSLAVFHAPDGLITPDFQSPEPQSPTPMPQFPEPLPQSLSPISQSVIISSAPSINMQSLEQNEQPTHGLPVGNILVTDSDHDTTITLSDIEIHDVRNQVSKVTAELGALHQTSAATSPDFPSNATTPPDLPSTVATPPDLPSTAVSPPDLPSTAAASPDLPQRASAEDNLFTPDKVSGASHFADAFHCPPTRSCIFYDALLSCLEIGEDDSEAVFSAALFYSMFTNVAMPHRPPAPFYYDDRIVDRLLNILDKSCVIGGIVRLVTVEIAVRLLQVLTTYDDKLMLQDNHLAVLTAVKENSIRFLRSFYTGEDNTLFVELFDEEYKDFLKRRPTNIAHLMSDECMLLGPVYTPLTGIDFSKRLPCGELEKMRKSLVVFFTVRKLWQEAVGEHEAELPLLNLSLQVSKGDILNLNNSDLIACAVSTDHDAVKRFLVIDTHQLILVEPDNAPGRLGYGIVQFVAPLQGVDAKPDKDSNRNLLIAIEKSGTNGTVFKARFQFEDHIRCFAAKTRLKQGRESLQKLKGFKLSHILDIPDKLNEEPFFGSSRSPLSVYKSGPEVGKGADSKLPSRPSSDSTSPQIPVSARSSRSSTTSLERCSLATQSAVITSQPKTMTSHPPPEQPSPGTPKRSLDKLPAPEVV